MAYVAHIILDMGYQMYAACRVIVSRKELWHIMRAAMLRHYLDDRNARAP